MKNFNEKFALMQNHFWRKMIDNQEGFLKIALIAWIAFERLTYCLDSYRKQGYRVKLRVEERFQLRQGKSEIMFVNIT